MGADLGNESGSGATQVNDEKQPSVEECLWRIALALENISNWCDENWDLREQFRDAIHNPSAED
jgi:hypothetical protein